MIATIGQAVCIGAAASFGLLVLVPAIMPPSVRAMRTKQAWTVGTLIAVAWVLQKRKS